MGPPSLRSLRKLDPWRRSFNPWSDRWRSPGYCGRRDEPGEAQCSRCSDDLNLIFVLERVVVPDTDTFYTGTKAEDTGDQVFGWVASTAVRGDSGRTGHGPRSQSSKSRM